MKLADLLREDLIQVGFRAKDKWEAIGKLLDALVGGGRIRADQRPAMMEALLARENVASTGMEHGVALPHAQIEGLDEAAASLAIAPEGIPFQSADGAPARLIFLLLIPRRSVQQHARTLAGIARLLAYEEMRESLARARTAREVLRLIRDEEDREPA